MMLYLGNELKLALGALSPIALGYSYTSIIDKGYGFARTKDSIHDEPL